jgi:hypothetical protein
MALDLVGKNIKAVENVKVFDLVYSRGLWGWGNRPLVYGAKKKPNLHCGGYIFAVQLFFLIY